jgi:hypothetical protein
VESLEGITVHDGHQQSTALSNRNRAWRVYQGGSSGASSPVSFVPPPLVLLEQRVAYHWPPTVLLAAARARAEKLRPVLTELADLSARAASIELNRRKVETPTGARWHPETVSRVRQRLDMK